MACSARVTDSSGVAGCRRFARANRKGITEPDFIRRKWNFNSRSGAIEVAGRMPESERIRDRDLLKRFRAGDRDAFPEIYRVHQKPVFRFALLMTGDSMKAAEVTQDVFVWLIHHPDDFDPA